MIDVQQLDPNGGPIRKPAGDSDDDLPAPGKVWDNSGPSLSELLKQQESTDPASPAPELEPEQPNVHPVTSSDLPEVWCRLLKKIEERGPALYSLVSKGRLVSINEGRAVIEYDRQHETFVKLLDRNGKKDVVRETLTQVYGEPLGVKFELAAAETVSESSVATAVTPPPVARPAPVRREVPAPAPTPVAPMIKVTPEIIESLRSSEPLIKSLMDNLNATIVKVEPADA